MSVDILAAVQAAAQTAESVPEAPEVPEHAPQAEVPTEAPVTATEPTAATDGAKRDASGRFAPKPEAQPSQAKPEGAAPPVLPQAQPAAPSAEPKSEPPKYRPPQAWRPDVREKFSALPPEVQAEIARLDSLGGQERREAAQAKKMAEAWEQTIAPYRPLLTDEPAKVVGNLLNTAKVLQVGHPVERASIAAKVIRDYNIPIDLIADMLEGKQPQGGHQQGPAEFRDPRVDALLAQMQQQQQRAQQSIAQSAHADVERFAPQAEFLEDVKDDMALLLEAAAQRGRRLSLEDAYKRACAMNESVAKVLDQRKAAQAATATQAATQRAMNASSSVKSNPTPSAPGARRGGSILDDVMAAAEAHRR